ncbi:DUF2829 domain-containing protein [Novosphingobium rosa]|uniref:DUF2829 domain-containing protein n=1 Tax=Novosphingobium rosa TaxID=76978 RepID=UPI000AF68B39|nr:DUF2829 domain-containing protein [Novosphingobium rosa]
MPQFRKRPIVIEAVQFDGFENEDEDTPAPMFNGRFHAPDWILDALGKNEGEEGAIYHGDEDLIEDLIIVTLEGNLIARPGDWIIKGVQGEIYPCKPDIFAATYDEGGQQDVGIGKNPLYRGNDMTFGQALDALKEGLRVARAGWNGKGMFLFLVPGSRFKVNRPPLLGIYEEGTEINYHAHIYMKTAQDTVVPWLASQTDALAEDWTVID